MAPELVDDLSSCDGIEPDGCLEETLVAVPDLVGMVDQYQSCAEEVEGSWHITDEVITLIRNIIRLGFSGRDQMVKGFFNKLRQDLK